eukprot:CAMPEP_0203760208 /NCGR_PEP_ID=MMETSP0098-20131031/13558_1 /ASSEMBLY_ACC=CAM_ASM_000208 /TAXON_ID=96639 /ORGANISM=" , Strain NY0313808BC1" /LENGTH=290 /DNA_ID=CAMNT_0050653685 /DNA_START=121 /DNA_END=993 /DNA_ORIENTATION=+
MISALVAATNTKTLSLVFQPASNELGVRRALQMTIVQPEANTTCVNAENTDGQMDLSCQGTVGVDLSDIDIMQFSFQAGPGKAIALNGPDRTRFEFQAKVPCGKGTPISLTPTIGEYCTEQQPNCAFAEYQDIKGNTFQPKIEGRNVTGFKYNADKSFVTIGRCEGCATCEIFTRLQFDGPVSNVEFESVTWSAKVDKAKTIKGRQTYSFGTDTYMWIRNPTSPGMKQSEPTPTNLVQLSVNTGTENNTIELKAKANNTKDGKGNGTPRVLETSLLSASLFAIGTFGRLV